MAAHLLFVDESGYMLTGTVCKTWAPRGETPTVRYEYRHDRLSVISGLSVSSIRERLGLFYQLHESNIRRPEVCLFLRAVLRHLRGEVVVVWDNGTIHKGDEIRQLLRKHPRLHVEYFPGYAPELNPDEWVWRQSKGALANSCPHSVHELAQRVMNELGKIKGEQRKLRACTRQTGLFS